MAAGAGRLRLLASDVKLIAGVRIMAGATPQTVAGNALALARRELLDMAGYFEISAIALEYEVGRVTRQGLTRLELSHAPFGPLNTRVAGEMTLAANRVALDRSKL